MAASIEIRRQSKRINIVRRNERGFRQNANFKQCKLCRAGEYLIPALQIVLFHVETLSSRLPTVRYSTRLLWSLKLRSRTLFKHQTFQTHAFTPCLLFVCRCRYTARTDREPTAVRVESYDFFTTL